MHGVTMKFVVAQHLDLFMEIT